MYVQAHIGSHYSVLSRLHMCKSAKQHLMHAHQESERFVVEILQHLVVQRGSSAEAGTQLRRDLADCVFLVLRRQKIGSLPHHLYPDAVAWKPCKQ